jgi:hypothetical protein
MTDVLRVLQQRERSLGTLHVAWHTRAEGNDGDARFTLAPNAPEHELTTHDDRLPNLHSFSKILDRQGFGKRRSVTSLEHCLRRAGARWLWDALWSRACNEQDCERAEVRPTDDVI